MRLPFSNRVEAGRLLAAELKQYRDRPGVIVIGLPRGGVSTAFEVARALRAPLDVMPVRKLGTPGQKELAMGAIAPGGVRVLDEGLIRELGVPQAAIERITAEEKLILEQRERSYRAGRPPLDLRDRTVILVDDGVATGSTMHAALKAVKQHRPPAWSQPFRWRPTPLGGYWRVKLTKWLVLQYPSLSTRWASGMKISRRCRTKKCGAYWRSLPSKKSPEWL